MKSKLILILILIFAMVEVSSAQDFNFIGSGARARGMGGAFIGVADDATAMSWNPAGLAKLEKPEASVVGFYESFNVTTDIEDYDTDAYKSSHANLNFASGAFPLSVGDKNVVAGIAYQQVIDMYSKYESEFSSSERTGGVFAISPSVGVQLTPNISLGASVNLFTGKTKYTSDEQFLAKRAASDELEYKYSGTNFGIGALMDFDKFRVGATFKTPFDLKEENEDMVWDVSYSIPQMIGIGASYMASQNLTLAADYEMRKFSDSEITNNETEESESLEWEDINQFRLGAEYLLQSGTNIIPVRLGLATTPTLGVDDNGDQITGINLTAGVGIIMGNINLDLGVEYNTYKFEITDSFTADTYDLSNNYLRFIVAGVFHFGQ